jgi:hypothetical protein
MLTNQDMFTFRNEDFARVRIEITFDAILFFSQSFFGPLEVVGDGVFSEEGFGFRLVILFGGGNEWRFEMFFVYL